MKWIATALLFVLATVPGSQAAPLPSDFPEGPVFVCIPESAASVVCWAEAQIGEQDVEAFGDRVVHGPLFACAQAEPHHRVCQAEDLARSLPGQVDCHPDLQGVCFLIQYDAQVTISGDGAAENMVMVEPRACAATAGPAPSCLLPYMRIGPVTV